MSGIKLVSYNEITSGSEFEYHCARLLVVDDFSDILVTKASQDYGVDITAKRGDTTYAIQCKLYSSTVGVKAVQEVLAGKEHYSCDIAVVMTNNVFSKNAINLASSTGIELWGRSELHGLEVRFMRYLKGDKDLNLSDEDIIKELNEQKEMEADEMLPQALVTALRAGFVNRTLLTSEYNQLSPGLADRVIKKMISLGLTVETLGDRAYKLCEDKILEFLKAKNIRTPEPVQQTHSVASSDYDKDLDDIMPDAIELAVEAGAISTTFLQRRLRLGYAQAGRLMNEMEQRGIVGPSERAKPRNVLLTKQQWDEMKRSAEEELERYNTGDCSKQDAIVGSAKEEVWAESPASKESTENRMNTVLIGIAVLILAAFLSFVIYGIVYAST